MCEQNSTEIPTACSTHTHMLLYREEGVGGGRWVMCEQNSTEIPTACSTHTHMLLYREEGGGGGGRDV